MSWRPLRKATGQRSQMNDCLQAANQRGAQILRLQRGELSLLSVAEIYQSICLFLSELTDLLSCSVTHQRTQTRLWLQLWPKTSVCSGESHTQCLWCDCLKRKAGFMSFLIWLINADGALPHRFLKFLNPGSSDQQTAAQNTCTTGSVSQGEAELLRADALVKFSV